MKRKILLFGLFGCALLWTLYAAAALGQKGQEKVLTSDPLREITLTQPTQVGNITLQPDTYVIQHRVAGKQHFVRFMRIETLHELNVTPESAGWLSYTEENTAGEINCRIELMGKVAQQSFAYISTEGGTPRITRVAIKGENDWHIFE